jgi:hypothetical protein
MFRPMQSSDVLEDDDGYYSPTPPTSMYPIHPLPALVNNSPLVLTGVAKWQSRKAKLWTELNPTISKDNTMGEAARQAKMLAEFAKNRPCMFGVKFDLQTSKEEPLHRARSFEAFEDVSDRNRRDEDMQRAMVDEEDDEVRYIEHTKPRPLRPKPPVLDEIGDWDAEWMWSGITRIER